MKRILNLAMIVTLLITLVACDTNKIELYRETTFTVGFNTPFTLMLYTKSQEDFDEHFKDMQEEVSYYNQLFDIYNEYTGVNNIKTINDNAGIEPIEVDPILIEMLTDAQDWLPKTEGLFNPSLGPVLKIWHDAREKGMALNRENKFGPSPNQETLEAANEFVGWEYVEIDREKNTVYLTDKNASLDVGSIAKGWAVEKAAQSLEKKGIEYGIVNGGGNVRLIGSKNGENWTVGITNPESKEDKALMSLNFDESMSVVTSGDYERFFIDEDGNQQHHLIDPRTLQPTRDSRSVTITTKDSGVADIISTAFAMSTLEESKKFEEKFNIDDLGLVFVKTEKEDETFGYHYEEVDGLHVYYNEQIKDHIKK